MTTLVPTSRHAAAEWRNESTQKPPKQAIFFNEINADNLLQHAHNNCACVWTGDFHNAKQVLAALKKRIRKSIVKNILPSDIQTAFHRHRLQQAQQSRLINMLAVEINTGFQLNLPRAPNVSAALADVYGTPNDTPFLLPLNQLLGFIGAHEWHKKGVHIAAISDKIHVPFGVFSPLRGEYLDLLMQAPLPPRCRNAFDIGTGSGILAALLAYRGIADIVATDTNPRAIACAKANLHRLGLNQQVRIEVVDLLPQGLADLIVCNPPWLPAKPTSVIEAALYDPDSAMLKGFLNSVAQHLTPDGEAWLIISDLAEHLQLRSPNFLAQCFQAASLQVIDVLQTQPQHQKATDKTDPLAFARNREVTYLYRLKVSN